MPTFLPFLPMSCHLSLYSNILHGVIVWGVHTFVAQKLTPLALLHSLVTNKYDASLRTCIIILFYFSRQGWSWLPTFWNLLPVHSIEHAHDFLTVVMSYVGRGVELSSGSLHCVAAPYVGLFYWWVASCDFIGVGWCNLCRSALTYLVMETSTVMFESSQLRVNPKNNPPPCPLWWHINILVYWKGSTHPACWWTWFQIHSIPVWIWFFLSRVSIGGVCAGLVHIHIYLDRCTRNH